MERMKIGRNIFVINKYFRFFLKDSLKVHNLNAAEGMVLLSLYSMRDDDNMIKDFIKDREQLFTVKTHKQLVADLYYDKSVMTRTIHSLEEKGYVERISNVNDHRSSPLNLTEKALNFKSVLFGIIDKWNSHVLKDFDENFLSTIEEITKKMAGNALNFMCNSKNCSGKTEN